MGRIGSFEISSCLRVRLSQCHADPERFSRDAPQQLLTFPRNVSLAPAPVHKEQSSLPNPPTPVRVAIQYPPAPSTPLRSSSFRLALPCFDRTRSCWPFSWRASSSRDGGRYHFSSPTI